MSERVRLAESSRGAAELEFKLAVANMFVELPDKGLGAVNAVVSALNDFLLRHPVFGGPVHPSDPHDGSSEPPVVIINPDRPR